MAEHQKTSQKKHEEGDQKQRTRQKQSEPLFDRFHVWEQGISAINETPFQPRMDEHAKLLADARSDTQRANLIIHLQRTYGNRYVQRLLNSMAIQAKLTVSQPDDVYEQEADRVASIVTQKISASEIQRQVPEEEEEEEEVEMKASEMQRQVPEEEEEEEEVEMKASEIQRQVPEEEEEEEEVEMKASEMQRQVPEEEEEIEMQPADSQPRTIPENLEKRINAARLNGKPMNESVRASFEPQFGVDFSNVRIHDNAEADSLSQQLEAKAFTTGQDIFFKSSEYNPGSSSGQHLLAHELTHVVQQRGGQLHSDVQGKIEKESPRSLISKSTSDVIQRNNDNLLDKNNWTKTQQKLAGKVYGLVKKYDPAAKAEKKSKILASIAGATHAWLDENRNIESTNPEHYKAIQKLYTVAEERWKEAVKQAQIEKEEETINKEILALSPAKVNTPDAVFGKFMQWCRKKGIRYHTGGKNFPIKDKGGQTYCAKLAFDLARVFKVAGHDAKEEKITQKNFITAPLPNFIDQKTKGNLKDVGGTYGDGGRRFFFTEHYVTKAAGTVYDPTTGEKGDPASKIRIAEFKAGTKTVEGRQESVYEKDDYWIRKRPGEVDCSVDGYELHSE